jgi:hypothetical protein
MPVSLVPRLRLGTRCPEAPPRRTKLDSLSNKLGAAGLDRVDCESEALRFAAEAEPPISAFPGRAWERVSVRETGRVPVLQSVYDTR